MAIKYHPDVGEILICDFSSMSTKEPEMTKKRPVIILSPRTRRGSYCTVVPLSTTAPSPVQLWNMRLHVNLPNPYPNPEVWVKGDMLYTVSFQRLSPFKVGKDEFGNRHYQKHTVSPEELNKVWQCVFNGLGLYRLAKAIDNSSD